MTPGRTGSGALVIMGLCRSFASRAASFLYRDHSNMLAQCPLLTDLQHRVEYHSGARCWPAANRLLPGLKQAPDHLINEMCIMTRFVMLLGWSCQHCQREICDCAGMRSRRSHRRLWWPRRRLALQQSWPTRRLQEHRLVSHTLIICAAQLSPARHAA